MSNQGSDSRDSAARGSGNVLPAQDPMERMLHMARIIDDATYAYSGQPGQDPFTVFKNPKTPGVHRRADVTVSQGPVDEPAFRQAMSELGVGRPENYDADAAGLHTGYLAFLEAGVWSKTLAEALMILRNPSSVTPGTVVIAASRGRQILSDERTAMARYLDISEDDIGDTEYDVAEQLVRRMAGFNPETKKIPYGYDHDGNAVETTEEESPFTGIGTLNRRATSVFMLEITPQYTDGDRQGYVQLNPRQKMRLLAQLWQKAGGTEVGFVTSNAYPSREVHAMLAARDVPGMRVALLSYGTNLYKTIVAPRKEGPPVGPLAAEAYAIAESLRDAYGELTA